MISHIAKEEWDNIVNLAVDYTFSEDAELKETLREQLLQELSFLNAKYRKNVDILATIAEYTTDITIKESLLIEALNLSIDNHDNQNQLMITSSLADLYFENQDCPLFLKWIDKLKELLILYPNSAEQMHYDYLHYEWSKIKENQDNLPITKPK